MVDSRREAVQVLLGGLRVALRPVGRADAALPQAHRRQAVPLPPLRALLLALRPPGAARQAPRVARGPRRPRAATETQINRARIFYYLQVIFSGSVYRLS